MGCQEIAQDVHHDFRLDFRLMVSIPYRGLCSFVIQNTVTEVFRDRSGFTGSLRTGAPCPCRGSERRRSEVDSQVVGDRLRYWLTLKPDAETPGRKRWRGGRRDRAQGVLGWHERMVYILKIQ